MKFINLTKHSITELTSGNTYKPSGRVAYIKTATVKVHEHGGCPIYESKFGIIDGLPEPKRGVMYIVSALTLNGTNRTDVVAPGVLQRDTTTGDPIGCTGFRNK